MEHIKTQSGGHRTLDPHHGHDPTDINIRGVLAFGFVLFISLATLGHGAWGVEIADMDRDG